MVKRILGTARLPTLKVWYGTEAGYWSCPQNREKFFNRSNLYFFWRRDKGAAVPLPMVRHLERTSLKTTAGKSKEPPEDKAFAG